MNKKTISDIEKGSIAEELELEKGDTLIDINGYEIEDVFDYRFLQANEIITLNIKKSNGDFFTFELEKDEDEDLGIIFDDALMDDVKSCKNKCIFCFIDQLPKGLRKSLYFKDDDSRFAFLYGNYLTLTNMTSKDLDRIIFYRFSPINISVHASDLEIRKKMLKNKKADTVFEQVKKLYDAKIEMNFQIVLCKGFNDADVLDKTISDLAKYIPYAKSLSVVPVGLTKYRDGLEKLEVFNRDDKEKVLEQISFWQEKFLKELGSRFVFASDEFYIDNNGSLIKDLKNTDFYEDFFQIENGVGMMALFLEELNQLKIKKSDYKKITIATALLSGNFFNKYKIFSKIEKDIDSEINVIAITNEFFGEEITVSGLLTYSDFIKGLKNKDLGDLLLIPENSLKFGENIFLDDKSLEELEKDLGIKIKVLKASPLNLEEVILLDN